jgi:hypothetical protein
MLLQQPNLFRGDLVLHELAFGFEKSFHVSDEGFSGGRWDFQFVYATWPQYRGRSFAAQQGQIKKGGASPVELTPARPYPQNREK